MIYFDANDKKLLDGLFRPFPVAFRPLPTSPSYAEV